jgi:hypothetical protein
MTARVFLSLTIGEKPFLLLENALASNMNHHTSTLLFFEAPGPLRITSSSNLIAQKSFSCHSLLHARAKHCSTQPFSFPWGALKKGVKGEVQKGQVFQTPLCDL